MTAGLSGAGAVGVAFESVMGTYVAPTIWVPILSESLKYTEERYYSPQIRQQVMVSDVKQGYYHTEGDIELEVDPDTYPYFMYASRHAITKTGAATPWTYKFAPSAAGATSTAASGAVQRTLSITVLKNGQWFGYAGCTVGQIVATVDAGVLKSTLSIIGLSEAEPSAPTPAWDDPQIYGADAHNVFAAASAVAPVWGTATTNFNGYTFTANHNPTPQNRIRADRAASYVSFGETEISVETELDFDDRAEYDNFVASTQKAFKLESTRDGTALATAADGVSFAVNRGVYETYDVDLSGLADIVMAGVTVKGIGINGGDAYDITVKSVNTTIA